MSVLRQARKAVFGETWLLPALVAALICAAVAIRAVAPGFWEDAGGLLLLGGAIATLVALTSVRAR